MYSFDVFDTLITRKTATPRGIFALMQEKLTTINEYRNISKHISLNFYDLRRHAEELARLNGISKGIEEVTLEDIYEALATTGCLLAKEQKMLCELERLTELENVVPMNENILKVKELLSSGERVILISDMYLDKETIQKMLIKADKIFEDQQLYVSSEMKCRKTNGKLYQKIKELEKIEYNDWTHFGNNPYQDIEIPHGLGIKAKHLEEEQLIDFEKEMVDLYGNTAQLQLIIGTSKNVRQQNGTSSMEERIGCSLSGPILYSYAHWIIEESKRKGIKRLYFIARDGYLIKIIADILIKKYELDIRTSYIYGSRRAWRIPSLSEENFDLYKIIQWSHTRKINSIQDFADLLMIPVEELFLYLPVGCRNADKIITNQILQYLSIKLDKNIKFKKYFLKRHSAARKLVIDYLKQEIDISDDGFAFVDVSGGGVTQGSLKNLLNEIYNKPIRTFFFKIDRINLVKDCINDTFIPSFMNNNLVIEMICRAPHGQTIRYEKQEDKIVPVLEEKEGKAILEHGFLNYQKGVESFGEAMAELQKDNSLSLDSIHLILKYIEYSSNKPNNDILEFFATMPNSETGREKRIVEFAPKLTKTDIENIYLRKTTEPLETYYKGTSLEYSLLRCSKEEFQYIEQCKKDYYSARGIMKRLDKEREEIELQNKYGIAYRFPCEILEENIILYGAGKFGQSLYNKIITFGISKIVQWVDKEFLVFNKQGLPMVESPDSIGLIEFDQLVIAVKKESLARAIQEELVKKGIPKDKIIWLDTNPRFQDIVNWSKSYF
jgi:predicted HAD superfamily hydrolase